MINIKTIGIITLYHNSANYGGLLQAYALVTLLNIHGYKAEQISVAYEPRNAKKETSRAKDIIKTNGYFSLISRIIRKVYRIGKSQVMRTLAKALHVNNRIQVRLDSTKQFRENIPHSQKTYTQNNIYDCDGYDVYICGSDQVWRGISLFDELNPAYWLTFVRSEKKKISYAASISRKSIPVSAENKVKEALCDFNAISVRENNDKKLLERVLDRHVEWVLDPTMLFSAEEWKALMPIDSNVEKGYLFVYLLGDSLKARRYAARLARKRGLKIVTIPYVLDNFRWCDLLFGDIRINDVSPTRWMSLIFHADFVVTDSFHCTAFSILFHKSFLTFKRDSDESDNSSNSRIYSLLDRFELTDRIVEINSAVVAKHNLDFVDNEIDYHRVDQILNNARELSTSFLYQAIGEP